MTIKLTNDGKALVDTRTKYIPIDPAKPPVGKAILINKWQGVAVIGEYRREFGWTHYHPLPTFPDADQQEAPQALQTEVRPPAA